MSTKDNLSQAFAGESQANRKYLCFAEQAEKDGLTGVARLFRATAEAETIHAFAEFKANGGVGSTADNLKAAKEGETYEFTSMYPPMIEAAKAEGNDLAARIFHNANEAEKVHAKLYEEALANLDKKEDVHYFLCPSCGFIAKSSAPEACPICGAKGASFREF